MSNPSLQGGGGITLDDVAVFLFNITGASTVSGAGNRYIDAQHTTQVT